jgi:hypothetical protein
MNELLELHLKGTLSEKGYLKETYDNTKEDLVHSLTDKGRAEIKGLFKDPTYVKEFMQMAVEEAKKHSPEVAKKILVNAVNKVREYK